MTVSIGALSTLPTRLADAAFDHDATPHDLLLVVSSLALLWAGIFYLLNKFLRPFAQRQQWLRRAMGREYDRVGLAMCKALSVKWSRERYIEIMLGDWPKMQGIYLQHFVGGALTIPAVMGYTDSWATSLACLGVLSEMGWELSDTADIFVTRTLSADGKERMPNAMVFIMMVHHSMTLTLGVPLVLRYRELPELHQLTFNLQWAAAIALALTEYTKCLDLTKSKHLVAFRMLNGLGFIIMAWMRGFYWIVLCYKLLTRFHTDEEWTFLYLGSVICVLITVFNVILCIYPFGRKMFKFSPTRSMTKSESSDTVDTVDTVGSDEDSSESTGVSKEDASEEESEPDDVVSNDGGR